MYVGPGARDFQKGKNLLAVTRLRTAAYVCMLAVACRESHSSGRVRMGDAADGIPSVLPVKEQSFVFSILVCVSFWAESNGLVDVVPPFGPHYSRG
jgi:hypothetical protein